MLFHCDLIFSLYWTKEKKFENPNFLRFSDQPSKREVIGIQSINGGLSDIM